VGLNFEAQILATILFFLGGGRPWVLEIELETFVVTCMLDGNGRHRHLNPTSVLVSYVEEEEEEEEEAVELQWKTYLRKLEELVTAAVEVHSRASAVTAARYCKRLDAYGEEHALSRQSRTR